MLPLFQSEGAAEILFDGGHQHHLRQRIQLQGVHQRDTGANRRDLIRCQVKLFAGNVLQVLQNGFLIPFD